MSAETEVIGVPLIVGGVSRPSKASFGRVAIHVWAEVAGTDFVTPATDAQSTAAWAGRSVTLQSSGSGSNWCDVANLEAISFDICDQDLFGPLYYRIVGPDLTNINATLIEVRH